MSIKISLRATVNGMCWKMMKTFSQVGYTFVFVFIFLAASEGRLNNFRALFFFFFHLVALSNIMKYSSWMILLGICCDVYQNGIQFLVFFFVGSTFMTIFMNFIIIPVFHESEVSTLSEVSAFL